MCTVNMYFSVNTTKSARKDGNILKIYTWHISASYPQLSNTTNISNLDWSIRSSNFILNRLEHSRITAAQNTISTVKIIKQQEKYIVQDSW